MAPKPTKALELPVSISRALSLARGGSSRALEKLRRKNALALFKEAAKRVPAYAAFLREHGVDPREVRTWEDFEKVPAVSKANYLRQHPLAELSWDGTLARPGVFSATSGSTGKPTYFQRSESLEQAYSALVELYLTQGEHAPSKEHPTLVIVGFGMGVWIGGMLTFRAYEIASLRGLPLSILPAGVSKPEILHALKELAPHFSQTILIGYPPFVKDVLDDAADAGIDLSKLALRLMFAAESFTEKFRDYLCEKAGIGNPARDTLNIYGTADIGAMAFETPTAILIRRLASNDPALFADLFGTIEKTPTLAQYHPAFMTFEATPAGEILLTGNSAMPLIRYAVGDHGGVRSFDEIEAVLGKHGIDIAKEAKRNSVPVYRLPFVYVYARVDLSTKLYGAIMYPEHVREALEDAELADQVSGKFTMQTVLDEKQNQALEINVELKRGIEPSDALARELQAKITATLIRRNAEYRNNHAHMGERVTPRVVLWKHEDPTYFKPGIKQKWVIAP